VKVLFQGEPGVGKGRCARRLHALRHPQAPYLCLSAPSLPAGGPDPRRLALLQGGSIYVSELEELAEAGWGPLARAMDSELGQGIHWLGSCRDPKELPEPLRLRMGEIVLRVPPLRERSPDILPMFRAFLDALARRDGRPVPTLARGAERELLQRAWPGNLGQLAWAVAQAWRATTGPVLAPLPAFGPEAGGALVLPWPEPGTLAAMLADVEQAAVAALLGKAMEGHRQDPALVAQGLGLAPRRLAGLLREHHISMEEE
jgi:DNA-binding NtrC family response regulator